LIRAVKNKSKAISPILLILFCFSFFIPVSLAEELEAACIMARIDYGDNTIKEEDSRVARYYMLLDDLQERCVNDREDIANILAKSTDLLEKKGVTITMYDFGRRIKRLTTTPGKKNNLDLTDTASDYIIVLTEKY